MVDSPTYKIENVKGRWTVFSIVYWGNKTFKNWVGDAPTKAGAEAIAAKAMEATP